MTPRGRIAVVALGVALSLGCDQESMIARHRQLIDAVKDEAATKAASGLLQAVIERRIEAAGPYMSPELWAEVNGSSFEHGLSELPTSANPALELIGHHTFSSGSTKRFDLMFQVRVEKRYLIGTARVVPSAGKMLVTAFRLVPLEEPLQDQHALSFERASIIHWLMLVFAAGVLVTCAIGTVLCFRTPIPKRKWLWMLYVCLGIGGLTLNWTTGQVAFELLRAQLLGVAATQSSPYDPWLLRVSLPVGAVHFMLRRRRWALPPS